MAKRTTAGKTSKKSGTRPASRPARKAAPRTAKRASRPARTDAGAAMPTAPAGGPIERIDTGKGPCPADLGARLVGMFNAGEPDAKVWDALFAKDFTSIEGHGVNMMFRGRKAIEDKAAGWHQEHRVHGARAEGPFVGSTGFAVRFTIDVENTKTSTRQTMNEIGVYTVQDGRVIQEEFMYGA